MPEFLQSDFAKKSLFIQNFAEHYRTSEWAWKEIERRFASWNTQKTRIETPIPKIVHQIWLGKAMPQKYQDFCRSWKILNPSYEYKLWDENEILNLGDFEGRDAFKTAPSYGAKSDIARYEILRRFGGIYVDTDFECLRPFDSVLDSCTLVVGNLYDSNPDICNALIAAVSGHHLISRLCSLTAPRIMTTELLEIIDRTGPGLLTREILRALPDLEETAIIFPSTYFYPFPNLKLDEKGLVDVKAKYATVDSLAIHYWEVSWSRVGLINYFIRKAKRGLKRLKKAARRLGKSL